jgi:hypothetical protein
MILSIKSLFYIQIFIFIYNFKYLYIISEISFEETQLI